ncbi:MCE family protein [Nocardioides ultimimeridianus]
MKVTGPAIRLAIFGLAGALMLVLLYLTLGQIQLGPSNHYSVLMHDVSGLSSGDLVRVAGVQVGQVDGLHLVGSGDGANPDSNEVRVDFHVADTQHLTDQTQVLVRYENLLGDRYLELAQGGEGGTPLPDGATIPADRATPALDLDVLLNGFHPLFEGLQPDQVNELATNLIQTLQGQGGTVQSLLAQTASLTNGLADDSSTITSLITHLDRLLGHVNSRDAQLRQTITQFRTLVTGLAKDRDPITTSVVSINAMAARLSSLFTQVRGPFHSTTIAVSDLARLLNTNTATLNKVLAQLPRAYQLLDRVGSHGSFFNFYLCSVQIKTGSAAHPIETPVVRSQVSRCN